MTFTPEVLTKSDPNNSTSVAALSFNGVSTVTTGYNTLFITVTSSTNSTPGGIEVYFSDDNVTWKLFYTDTYFATPPFTRSYLIVKKYYKIAYTAALLPASLSVTSRLSTQLSSNLTQTTSITVFDSSVENTLDAFGKLRVSSPFTLLDIRFPGQTVGGTTFLSNSQQVISATSGAFTGVYQNSKLVMSGTGVGYYISQSRNYCVYQPGKSLQFLASGVFNPANATMTSRIGYLDHDVSVSPPVVRNGVYLEFSGGVASVNIKNNTVVSVPQSQWNIDQMDGTGPSGLNLDFTKTQLFTIDMEWLGVGRVRCGFFAYGRIQYCHQFPHVNELIQPYTNSINLPITFALLGSTPAQSGTLTQICSTVISEGGYNPVGRPFSVNTTTETNVPQTETPILALRGGAASFYHQNIIPTASSIIDSTNNNTLLFRLRIYPAGTSAGTITWSDVNSSYSVAQYATNANITGFTTTGSILLESAYFLGKGSNVFTNLDATFTNLLLQITSNIANVSDILLMTCTRINSGTDAKVSGTISWQEFY